LSKIKNGIYFRFGREPISDLAEDFKLGRESISV
jgi:hypothetical protein